MRPTRFRTFARDEKGVVAIIFGLLSVPVFGMVGGAVDYWQTANDRAKLQRAFDTAALAGARMAATRPTNAVAEARSMLDAVMDEKLRRYSPTISVNGSTVTVQVRDTFQTTFLPVVGIRTLPMVVTSVARGTLRTTVTSPPPQVANLDYEAGDYNRIYVYCFDKNRTNQPDKGRTQMTAIADNGGTSYNYTMPRCREGETLSYRLYNVRNARTKPWLWDNATPGVLTPGGDGNPWGGNQLFEYFTDTTSSNGVLTQNIADDIPMVETALCDTMASCKPRSQGGVLPEGKNRSPQAASQACSPGKFMYYGWEDRPPGYGWTDQDYDDIRIVVECPQTITNSTLEVRLIQ